MSYHIRLDRVNKHQEKANKSEIKNFFTNKLAAYMFLVILIYNT
jgi:hypothetical protein